MNPTISAKLTGIPSSAQALALARLILGNIPPLPAPASILHIATSDRALESLQQALLFFAPDVEIITFPAWDCMPYDRSSPQPVIMAARMQALARLSSLRGNNKPFIILTTASAILQKLPPEDIIRKTVFLIKRGEKLKLDALTEYLTQQGYRRTGKAMEPGEFAMRGGIIDIIPSGASEGVRIDLFGDEVESMKPFDPMTQLSGGAIDKLNLYPISEVLLTEENIARFRSGYRDLFGAVSKEDPLYEAISKGISYPGMEHWLPLFYERAETLMDYCENSLLTFDGEVESSISERQEAILDYYEARKTATGTGSKKNSFVGGSVYHPIPADSFFIMKDAWAKILASHNNLSFSPFSESGGGNEISLGFRPTLRFMQGQADNTPFSQDSGRKRQTDHTGLLYPRLTRTPAGFTHGTWVP